MDLDLRKPFRRRERRLRLEMLNIIGINERFKEIGNNRSRSIRTTVRRVRTVTLH